MSQYESFALEQSQKGCLFICPFKLTDFSLKDLLSPKCVDNWKATRFTHILFDCHLLVFNFKKSWWHVDIDMSLRILTMALWTWKDSGKGKKSFLAKLISVLPL